MKIAVAQIRPAKGNITENVTAHKKMIDLVIARKTDAVFFPELSITGYEPTLAKVFAQDRDDKIFDDFQEMSNENNITIGVGVPTKANAGIQISMLIFQPNVPRKTYSKQQLHADEFPYFVGGDEQIILTINKEKIAPAICYESLQAGHSNKAMLLGANIYVASVAKSQNGIDKAMQHYPAVARKFSIPVLMSNCVGSCDNFQSVGKSSVWTKQGALIGQLADQQEGVLIFNTETEEIIEQAITLT
ncbi:carbon-nitrogen hydrolase family protein [Niabella sp. CC-SYL272]|uniref:carbon-nitrogen hydrolase family protein n=1 Tax=Niabella agricola TaxID=2891571 RepID=UPI001F2A4BEF|nr:carbon-nitrogen hydrolase family protein [Niabella agricola]MCF3109723.1 carbon-nitrogen hydrolase family protein [Niabella agricola]